MGWALACYFGGAGSESVNIGDYSGEYTVKLCTFNNLNPIPPAITIYQADGIETVTATILNNTVYGQNIIGIGSTFDNGVNENNLTLMYNNLNSMTNTSTSNIIAEMNYWNGSNPQEVIKDGTNGYGPGIVDYTPFITEQFSPDDDVDGLTNLEEELILTDPRNQDTDGDGVNDRDEIYYDGNASFNPYNWVAHTGTDLDPRLWDTDNDDFSDGEELRLGTNPIDGNDFPQIPASSTTGLIVLTTAMAAAAITALYNRKEKAEDEPLV